MAFPKLSNQIDVLSTVHMQVGNLVGLDPAELIEVLLLLHVDLEAGQVDVGGAFGHDQREQYLGEGRGLESGIGG